MKNIETLILGIIFGFLLMGTIQVFGQLGHMSQAIEQGIK